LLGLVSGEPRDKDAREQGDVGMKVMFWPIFRGDEDDEEGLNAHYDDMPDDPSEYPSVFVVAKRIDMRRAVENLLKDLGGPLTDDENHLLDSMEAAQDREDDEENEPENWTI